MSITKTKQKLRHPYWFADYVHAQAYQYVVWDWSTIYSGKILSGSIEDANLAVKDLDPLFIFTVQTRNFPEWQIIVNNNLNEDNDDDDNNDDNNDDNDDDDNNENGTNNNADHIVEWVTAVLTIALGKQKAEAGIKHKAQHIELIRGILLSKNSVYVTTTSEASNELLSPRLDDLPENVDIITLDPGRVFCQVKPDLYEEYELKNEILKSFSTPDRKNVDDRQEIISSSDSDDYTFLSLSKFQSMDKPKERVNLQSHAINPKLLRDWIKAHPPKLHRLAAKLSTTFAYVTLKQWEQKLFNLLDLYIKAREEGDSVTWAFYLPTEVDLTNIRCKSNFWVTQVAATYILENYQLEESDHDDNDDNEEGKEEKNYDDDDDDNQDNDEMSESYCKGIIIGPKRPVGDLNNVMQGFSIERLVVLDDATYSGDQLAGLLSAVPSDLNSKVDIIVPYASERALKRLGGSLFGKDDGLIEPIRSWKAPNLFTPHELVLLETQVLEVNDPEFTTYFQFKMPDEISIVSAIRTGRVKASQKNIKFVRNCASHIDCPVGIYKLAHPGCREAVERTVQAQTRDVAYRLEFLSHVAMQRLLRSHKITDAIDAIGNDDETKETKQQENYNDNNGAGIVMFSDEEALVILSDALLDAELVSDPVLKKDIYGTDLKRQKIKDYLDIFKLLAPYLNPKMHPGDSGQLGLDPRHWRFLDSPQRPEPEEELTLDQFVEQFKKIKTFHFLWAIKLLYRYVVHTREVEMRRSKTSDEIKVSMLDWSYYLDPFFTAKVDVQTLLHEYMELTQKVDDPDERKKRIEKIE